MKHDIALLTFLSDPIVHPVGSDSLSAFVPKNIVREEDLFTSLNEQLHFPVYFSMNWNSLHEVMRVWSNWTQKQYVVIVHQDLPLLSQTEKGWFLLKIYLEILLDSIAWIQKNSEGELVVIFPLDTYEIIYKVLTHSLVWEMELSLYEFSIQGVVDPSWREVSQYLEYLDGLTASTCTISREDAGSMTVQYIRKTKRYFIEYHSQNPKKSFMALSTDDSSFPAILPFSISQQIIKEFFATGQCPSSVSWFALSDKTYHQRIETLEHLSYRNDEDVFLERRVGAVRKTIVQGIKSALDRNEKAFSLEYWRKILMSRNLPTSLYLSALCIVGYSNLPEAPILLLPFLESLEKRERWVSARFLGMIRDERTLPILVSMLIDEPPILIGKSWSGQAHWYENWRSYAPKLLRKWQTPEVLASLQNALAHWIQIEHLFDQEFDFWREYEAELCYELGYRADFTLFTTLVLEENHRYMLMIDAARGYLTAAQKLTLYEEYLQQKHFWHTYKSIQEDLISILDTKFGISRNIASVHLKEYRLRNKYNFF